MLGLLLFYDGTARVEIIIICVNYYFFFLKNQKLLFLSHSDSLLNTMFCDVFIAVKLGLLS